MTDDVTPSAVLAGAALLGGAVVMLGRAWDQRPARAPDDGRRSAIATGAGAMAAPPPPPIAGWVFPVPNLADRLAEVSDGWGSPRSSADGAAPRHLGVDVMFRRRDRRELVDVYRPGTPHGTADYFMPDGIPALAAAAGVVTFATNTPRGFTVKIKHPDGWTTYYTHLSALVVVAGQIVAAGQPLGAIGGDPLDPRHLMHLHFELWRDHVRAGAIDPAPHLRAWRRRTLDSAGGFRTRGATLTYRPVGSPGERYPSWVQALRGQSGVYVIRERQDDGKPIIVYVGESHTDRLYETLTRHFQTWRRFKGFWRGQYAEGHDPGLTYPRDLVEVAVRELAGSDAIDEEARLIRRLRPRDNLLGQPGDVPF